MGDDIEINVTETTNIIEITPQPNDQIVDIAVTDNAPNVEINVTPSVVEINVTRGSSTAIWGAIEGNLTDQTDLVTALGLKADLVGGKVPSTQLPSYVDDVVEVANYAALPTSGEIGKIYITLDNNKIFRWSGSVYIEIAANQAIWGGITGNLGDQTDLQNALNTKEPTITAGTTSQYWRGDKSWQTLDKSAVGLGNVDNTSDLNKPISTATQTALDGKFDDPTGDTTQYIAGDGSLITFPVAGQSGTLVRQVRNTTGATLTKGTIVYISGANGNKPTVSKAIATGDSTSAQTFGMLQADLANNSNGYVVCVGDIIGLDTSAITEGTQLYLSSTVAGAYTTTKQVAPAHLVYIGVVTRSHPTLGQIEVKIQNGYELDEIHDVLITSKANNQFLVYESASSLWKNKSLSTILGGTSSQFLKGDGSLDSTSYVPTARTLTINGTAYDLSANRSWTITAGVWGQITGILSDQTDLQTALDAKTPTARTLTINGTSYDLSANRSWTIPTHDAVTIGTANGLSLSTQVLSLGLSSGSTNGALSSTDWTTFNNKQGALTFTSPLVNTSGTVSIPAATGSVNGYLTSTDWTTFNSKQGELNGTGFVKISGTTISYDNSTYALDSVVVKLSGSQTIGGSKTFSADTYLDNNIYLKKTGSWANPANYSVIGGMTHGFFLSSGTNKHAYLDLFSLTQARQYSFPNQSGTFAMTTDIPTISGTTNYISKFTGAATLGNSSIFDNGQVNIGSTSFAGDELLMISMNGTTNSQAINVKDRNASANASTFMVFRKSDDTFLGNIRRSGTSDALYIGGNSFLSLGVGGNTEAIRIFSNGNTFIGSTPTDAGFKLDVNGTLRVGGSSGGATTPTAITMDGTYRTGGAAFDKLKFYLYKSSTETYGFGLGDLADVQYWAGTTSTGAHRFFTSQTERMRITSDGRVGIGVDSVSKTLQVAGESSIASFRLSPKAGTYENYRLDIVTQAADTGAIKMSLNDNTFLKTYGYYFLSGLSLGVAGYEDLLHLNNGGKVGVGTITPNEKFSVASTDEYLLSWIRTGNSKRWAFGADSGGTYFSNRTDSLIPLYITNTNNVLINTTSDNGYRFQVNGGQFGTYLKGGDYGTGSNILLLVDAGGNPKYQARGDGRHFFTGNMDISGTVTATGGFFNSDIRLKELTDYDYSVLDIKPISYYWKDKRDDKKHVGYSAQEVQKVMPDAVNEDENGYLSVNYIEVLVAKIAAMEKEIEILKSK